MITFDRNNPDCTVDMVMTKNMSAHSFHTENCTGDLWKREAVAHTPSQDCARTWERSSQPRPAGMFVAVKGVSPTPATQLAESKDGVRQWHRGAAHHLFHPNHIAHHRRKETVIPRAGFVGCGSRRQVVGQSNTASH